MVIWAVYVVYGSDVAEVGVLRLRVARDGAVVCDALLSALIRA